MHRLNVQIFRCTPTLRMITGLLALFSILAPAIASAQGPEGHERWIGTSDEESGKGELYDFRFQPSGEVQVEKSTGTQHVKQSFHWTAVGDDIRLTGDSTGAILERSATTLKNAGEHGFHQTVLGSRGGRLLPLPLQWPGPLSLGQGYCYRNPRDQHTGGVHSGLFYWATSKHVELVGWNLEHYDHLALDRPPPRR